jgi:hypothetical protein
MPSSRAILITLGVLVSLRTNASAAEKEHITLGVGLSHVLSVEGGLSEKVEIKVTGDKVATADVVNRRRVYLRGRRAGNVTPSFTTLDGKRHQYRLDVVKPTKKILEPTGTKLIDIGVGQARFIDVPENFIERKMVR